MSAKAYLGRYQKSMMEIFMKEVVHLTFPPHIFSVQVKSGACYITGV